MGYPVVQFEFLKSFVTILFLFKFDVKIAIVDLEPSITKLSFFNGLFFTREPVSNRKILNHVDKVGNTYVFENIGCLEGVENFMK